MAADVTGGRGGRGGQRANDEHYGEESATVPHYSVSHGYLWIPYPILRGTEYGVRIAMSDRWSGNELTGIGGGQLVCSVLVLRKLPKQAGGQSVGCLGSQMTTRGA